MGGKGGVLRTVPFSVSILLILSMPGSKVTTSHYSSRGEGCLQGHMALRGEGGASLHQQSLNGIIRLL